MPKIIPIKELKDTAKVSLMVRESASPVYVTKNGYDDMVIMTMEEYDRLIYERDLYEGLLEGTADIVQGKTIDAFESIEKIRQKYGLHD
jgi:PHD/YefM family antitoxin component YafN of YafNO toxin-antitoxin module